MNIKLISPAVTRRPMDSAWKTHMAPPLALGVLAALTPDEHTLQVCDENVERLHTDDLPDLVGITVKADTYRRSCRIATTYRRRGVPVVMGGIHPTACPDDCAANADAVVVGPAERVWGGLLNDLEQGGMKPVYRDHQPGTTPPAPMPRWDVFRAQRYLFTNTLTAGRGCPWRCDFCYNSSPNVSAGYQPRPVESVLQDIRALGTRHVMFIDDNFIGDPQHARALVRAMLPLGLTWHTAVSADIGQHETLLDEMADSGCKSLFIGFESVNPKNLSGCSKVQNRIERYDTTIARIHERGMLVNASLVFGFDHDAPSVFEDTLAWLLRVKPASMTAHILTPYPGTRLHARLVKEGRIIDNDLEHYNTSRAVFRPARMSPEELEQGYLWMYERFYSWAGILRRLPADHRQLIPFLEFNLLYRKYGRVLSGLGLVFGMRRLAKTAKWVAYRGRRQGCGFRRELAATVADSGPRGWPRMRMTRAAPHTPIALEGGPMGCAGPDQPWGQR